MSTTTATLTALDAAAEAASALRAARAVVDDDGDGLPVIERVAAYAQIAEGWRHLAQTVVACPSGEY